MICCSFGALLFYLIAEMVAYIRYEDQMDGMSKYLQWKFRMTAIVKECRLWIMVSTMITPFEVDTITLDIHEVKEAKAQRMILDGIRGHLIPHVAEKKNAYEMYTTLKGLYEAKNENQIMAI